MTYTLHLPSVDIPPAATIASRGEILISWIISDRVLVEEQEPLLLEFLRDLEAKASSLKVWVLGAFADSASTSEDIKLRPSLLFEASLVTDNEGDCWDGLLRSLSPAPPNWVCSDWLFCGLETRLGWVAWVAIAYFCSGSVVSEMGKELCETEGCNLSGTVTPSLAFLLNSSWPKRSSYNHVKNE